MPQERNNIFTSLYRSFNGLNRKTLSVVVLILFCILTVLGLIIHEPTFDETKAWLIARDAPVKDLFFLIPHYEGHPPFWHLLLAVPAKAGIPFEAGLKTVQFISSMLLISVFLFLTPFNNTVRTVIPFTYFFLVRYNIYSRPYALLCASMLLASYFYGRRREKPLQFILILALICLWSLYGIAIAGGFALAWIIEIMTGLIKEKKSAAAFFLEDKKRTAGFILLLLFACFLLFLMNPYKDNFIFENNALPPETYIYRFVLFILSAPSECMFTSFFGDEFFYSQQPTLAGLAVCYTVSSVFYFLLIARTSDKKKLLWFFLPYVLYSVISTVYTSTHHFGIIIFLLLFYFAVTGGADKKEKRGRGQLAVKAVSAAAAVIFVFTGLYWSLSSFLTESLFKTSFGGELSSWIVSCGIDSSDIHSAWHIDGAKEGSVKGIYPAYGTEIFIPAAPYFKGNIMSNSLREETFTVGGGYSEEEINAAADRLKGMDPPEFIFSSSSSNAEDYISYAGFGSEYVPVYKVNESLIFKNEVTHYLGGIICCRRDLLDKYGLEEIPYM
jgi:hypothetical protein